MNLNGGSMGCMESNRVGYARALPDIEVIYEPKSALNDYGIRPRLKYNVVEKLMMLLHEKCL